MYSTDLFLFYHVKCLTKAHLAGYVCRKEQKPFKEVSSISLCVSYDLLDKDIRQTADEGLVFEDRSVGALLCEQLTALQVLFVVDHGEHISCLHLNEVAVPPRLDVTAILYINGSVRIKV